MADNRYKDFTDEAIKQLERLEKSREDVQRKLEARQQKNLSTETRNHKKLIEQQSKYEKKIDSIIEKEKQRLQFQKEYADEFSSFLNKFNLLSKGIKDQLSAQNKSAASFVSLGAQISKEKAIQQKLQNAETNKEKESLAKSQERESVFQNITDAYLSQAQSTQNALDDLKGLSQAERQIRDIKESEGVYDAVAKQRLINAIQQTELLRQKEEEINSIKQSQQDLYNSIPGPIKDAIDFGKGLLNTLKTAGAAAAGFVLLTSILASVVISFVSLDQSSENFRENTGIAVSQMKEMNSQANRVVGEFRELGLEAQDYFDIQKEIVGVLGDTARVSDSIAGAQAVLTKNFGVSNQAAAKTLQIFQSLGGVSENTAASLQLQTMELAKQAGVAPAKVLEDIAESSDAIYGAFRGNSEELVKQAVQARRLGTNLKDVLETTDKLLDFESSITSELEAAAFVGGQFNLTQARSLRAAGDIAGAQEEILRQIQRSGDFRQQDVFTQRALAEAAGMTVDEIARQLTTQDKLNSLGADQRALAENAIKQGLDITNINDTQLEQEVQKFALQKEQQGAVSNLSNAFQGLVATLGSSLVPLLESIVPILNLALLPIKAMVTGLKMTVDFFKENRLAAIALGTVLGGLVIANFSSMMASIVGTFSRLGPFGVPIGIATALGAASMIKNKVSSLSLADDLMGLPSGYGDVMVTKQGEGTIALNNDDTFIAGTNLRQGSQNLQSNSPVISMDGVVKELKELKKEFSKTRDTYIDGVRVTGRIGRIVDESTRNNFSLA